jgi:4-hydroxy-tetrahydrodipicolinate synthase
MRNLEGTYTAIVTPFKKGELDEQGLRENIEHQIKNGVSGIVPAGCTGEAATLTPEEHKRIMNIAIEQANGRVKVIPGTGSNNTIEAIAYTKHAKDAGADAALVITPYYNKPTQRGLIAHYGELAKIGLPIVMYTVPSRTGINILPETTLKLANEHSEIISIKDAAGSLNQVSETVIGAPAGFTVLSGDDSLTVPMMSVGARGVISVASNIIPKEVSQMVNSALKGDWLKAKELHQKSYPVFRALFVETNPIPVKAAMGMIGRAGGIPRMPLQEAEEKTKQELTKALKGMGLI